jgi:hypothetical protein
MGEAALGLGLLGHMTCCVVLAQLAWAWPIHTSLHAHHDCRLDGGLDAEREERKAIKAEEEKRSRRNFEAMQEIRKEGWRKVGCLLQAQHHTMFE